MAQPVTTCKTMIDYHTRHNTLKLSFDFRLYIDPYMNIAVLNFTSAPSWRLERRDLAQTFKFIDKLSTHSGSYFFRVLISRPDSHVGEGHKKKREKRPRRVPRRGPCGTWIVENVNKRIFLNWNGCSNRSMNNRTGKPSVLDNFFSSIRNTSHCKPFC
jgi:hypothetical protein